MVQQHTVARGRGHRRATSRQHDGPQKQGHPLPWPLSGLWNRQYPQCGSHPVPPVDCSHTKGYSQQNQKSL
ncbi:hypothetical protein D187_007264 [Cystobacter fuscus DSM 2262]|uniref:Uncharacterized protein n=1 Tax=Cystobacter fuscus (strain ATCC 25194 / DSM 2262 / NBRC 100088 / M29) TaxID=1242864 RepID=S9Q670_CYSF2|nr:hypothetical protein D187_007264 [Cystobacter fuscus DSM 2262]